MRVLFLCLVLAANIGRATEVRLSVYEENTQKTRYYAFDVAKSALKSLSEASGKAVEQTTTYSVKDRRLFGGDKILVKADEILYQCHIDGRDVVVVRDEYNSFSNPMRMLVAFAGHPVQVSKIMVLKIVDGKLETTTRIIRRPSSYRWRVSVYE